MRMRSPALDLWDSNLTSCPFVVYLEIMFAMLYCVKTGFPTEHYFGLLMQVAKSSEMNTALFAS